VLPPSYDTSSNSGLGGGQVGCNWQSGLWVLGIEGDIDGMNLSKTVGLVTGIDQVNGTRISTGQILVGNDSVIASEHVSQHWLSTVRGRLGFAPMQQLYIYGTGGLAIGGVSMNGSVIGEGAGAAIVWSGSSSDTKAGYAVGGGAEYAINGHWSLKGEYIYFDLGTVKSSPRTRLEYHCVLWYSLLNAREYGHAHQWQHRARRAELSIPLI
jgi:outer membrane immunogenic protein